MKDRPVAEETSLVLIEITEQGFEGVCDLRRDEKQHAPARIVEVDIRVTAVAFVMPLRMTFMFARII